MKNYIEAELRRLNDILAIENEDSQRKRAFWEIGYLHAALGEVREQLDRMEWMMQEINHHDHVVVARAIESWDKNHPVEGINGTDDRAQGQRQQPGG